VTQNRKAMSLSYVERRIRAGMELKLRTRAKRSERPHLDRNPTIDRLDHDALNRSPSLESGLDECLGRRINTCRTPDHNNAACARYTNHTHPENFPARYSDPAFLVTRIRDWHRCLRFAPNVEEDLVIRYEHNHRSPDLAWSWEIA